MAVARAASVFPGTVHEAERCWYDTGHWAEWVNGLADVVSTTDDWPEVGSAVIWESGPAGRGRVSERVTEHEPLGGITTDVQDESITGRQSVRFSPSGDEVQVELTLDYELRRKTIFTPLVDLLFIRRAMTMSLRATLDRFGPQLATSRERDQH